MILLFLNYRINYCHLCIFISFVYLYIRKMTYSGSNFSFENPSHGKLVIWTIFFSEPLFIYKVRDQMKNKYANLWHFHQAFGNIGFWCCYKLEWEHHVQWWCKIFHKLEDKTKIPLQLIIHCIASHILRICLLCQFSLLSFWQNLNDFNYLIKQLCSSVFMRCSV